MGTGMKAIRGWFVFFLAALLLPLCASADILISEVMASNGFFESGHAWDWVELYNDGKSSVDLSGWHLSDSKKNPLKWRFPEGTRLKAGKYLTVWCTGEEGVDPGKGSAFYTDFAISSGGETLFLSDAEGKEIQRLELPPQYGCVSYGLPRGGGDYGFFENPTRGAKNGRESFPARTERCLWPRTWPASPPTGRGRGRPAPCIFDPPRRKGSYGHDDGPTHEKAGCAPGL